MKDQSKTKQELIEELVILRDKVAELEGSKSDLSPKKKEGKKAGEKVEKTSGPNTIRVLGINITWEPDQGICTFQDLPVAMMWIDTTLSGMMSGVQAMVGTDRFFLALQSEGRKSVGDDWQIISQSPNFHEGFKAIANIAAVAGWGYWELSALDLDQKMYLFGSPTAGRADTRNHWGCAGEAVCWPENSQAIALSFLEPTAGLTK